MFLFVVFSFCSWKSAWQEKIKNHLAPTKTINQIWCRIHNTLFSSWLASWPDRQDHLSPQSHSSLVECNTLAYWTHSWWVAKKIKCCEYAARIVLSQIALWSRECLVAATRSLEKTIWWRSRERQKNHCEWALIRETSSNSTQSLPASTFGHRWRGVWPATPSATSTWSAPNATTKSGGRLLKPSSPVDAQAK